ncbi:hypothetical protein AOC36_02745 [Erysipelothrix larvae]|uniref:1,4-dihydroxy-2-naphthoate prenyltransferase n=1 Tax=Erysipelothrix larvae TaxID=1514105 RepID=A0A120JTI3_9FIRM|nr:UbiA family prenyltransferase [Erysipelothrix larvae]AMC92940.1 hypothetical protein AOC36_02745 [Erysipelothrix larvae]
MIKRLLKFIEIQTKITSLFPFLLMIGFMISHSIDIDIVRTSIFFWGMIFFDLTTTAINNTIDSKTNDQDLGFTNNQAKIMCFSLLAISTLMGIILVVLTDWIVLILGMFCFAVGILYTFGPIPISRTPMGEFFSGILHGYFAPFILLYINVGAALLSIEFGDAISIQIHTQMFVDLMIVGMVPTLLIANIMLGNNTCDVEADVKVNRFTLPFYLGKPLSIVLMRILYAGVYVGIISGVVWGVYHPIVLITLFTAPIVMKHVSVFKEKMIKHISFVNVIKNFMLVMGVLNVMVYLSILL